MRFTPVEPPRRFRVGFDKSVELADCASIGLEADEQVTLTTVTGGELDVTRKSWGFYATPSLNSRLPGFGLHGRLVRNRVGHLFVVLVEAGHEAEFDRYRAKEGLEVVAMLDEPAVEPTHG